MMWQWIAIVLIVTYSVAYIIYRIYLSFSNKDNPCYGCKGCDRKQQMTGRHDVKEKSTSNIKCKYKNL